MSPMKIIQEKSLNIYEAKKVLEEVKEQQNELNFRAEKTFDYLQQVSELDEKKAKELFDKLTKLNISRLKEPQINAIINLLPKKEEDVKMILQGYSITLTKEAIEQIISAVAEFLGKKEK